MSPPPPTSRLRLREMAESDLDDMAALLGDTEVMRYYPSPKSRDEALSWIRWNLDNYDRHGFGLWIVETLNGDFVGDCGLTMQLVDGIDEVEVGYHVRTSLQGRGLATEAATACRNWAAAQGIDRLIAIIHPANTPSQSVAGKLGLTLEKTAIVHGRVCRIHATRLTRAESGRH